MSKLKTLRPFAFSLKARCKNCLSTVPFCNDTNSSSFTISHVQKRYAKTAAASSVKVKEAYKPPELSYTEALLLLVLKNKMASMLEHSDFQNVVHIFEELDQRGYLKRMRPQELSEIINNVVKSYCHQGNPVQAMQFIKEVKSRFSLKISTTAVNSIIAAFCKKQAFNEAIQLLRSESYIKPNVETFTILIESITRTNEQKMESTIMSLLDTMTTDYKVKPTELIYQYVFRYMHQAYGAEPRVTVLGKQELESLKATREVVLKLAEVMKNMLAKGLEPSVTTMIVVLRPKSYKGLSLQLTSMLFKQVKITTGQKLVRLYTMAINAFHYCNQHEECFKLLVDLPEPQMKLSLASYNQVITGLCSPAVLAKETQERKVIDSSITMRKAEMVFNMLEKRSLLPNLETFLGLFRGYKLTGNKAKMKEVLIRMNQFGIRQNKLLKSEWEGLSTWISIN